MSLKFLSNSEILTIKFIYRNDEGWKNEKTISYLIQTANSKYRYRVKPIADTIFKKRKFNKQQVLMAISAIESNYDKISFPSHQKQLFDYLQWMYKKAMFDGYQIFWKGDEYDPESGAKIVH